MGYITLNDAKEWLGIPSTDATKDSLITPMIESVAEAINAWTESNFTGPIVKLKEIHDASRQDIILPKGYPLISIQAIWLGVRADGSNGALLDDTNYNFDDVEIRLRLLNLPQQRGYLALDYTWGYATTPERVKLATRISVEGYYRMRIRQAVGVTSKSKEGESINFKASWHAEAGLPIEAVSLLSDFRRIEWPDGAGGEMATRRR